MATPLEIGLLVFPDFTQLDLTGPVQVFSSLPNANVHLLWKRIEPVKSDGPIVLTPTKTFADSPQLDVICVPGGYGTDALMEDGEVLAFLRQQSREAAYVTSVCTGSLVLGAAGLLKGYRAATHWSAREALPYFDAILSEERVCIDRNRRRDHGRNRFRADAGLAPGRQADRRGDPASHGIQSGAALQRRFAGHGTETGTRGHAGEDGSRAGPPARSRKAHRGAVTIHRPAPWWPVGS